VGRSGSGKTTLLKCIYGLEDLHKGSIHLNQEQVLGPAFNLIPGHENMKLVSQDFYVLDNHTVAENIFDKLLGYSDGYKERRATQIMKLLELMPLREVRAINLSSGQKQRVAIARALAIIPGVLLLDEPFSNLDHLLTAKLFAFITKEVRKQKTAVILITHLGEEALKFADRIAVMEQGKIVEQAEKWKLYYKPKNKKLAGLLGEYNVVRKEDLTSNSSFKNLPRIFVRPDKIKIAKGKKFDLRVQAISSVFNGKCFEVLCESKSGQSILLYAERPCSDDEQLNLQIEDHLPRS
jgi:iron(III) transport system ATP-binding protein